MYAAILAGGVGTRLWPRSRIAQPKQFADISGAGRTMIQATADRLAGLVSSERLYVLTGRSYAEITAAQLPDMPAENILVEPSGRNTAPAIGLACIHLRRRDPEGVLAILPADHIITDVSAFQAALLRGAAAAHSGRLVTLGIEPTFPHTGYGYIKRQGLLSPGGAEDLPIYSVERFYEKPDLATAERFLAAGGFYWNGGIFISRVDRMLAEMERQLPELYSCLLEIEAGLESGDGEAALQRAWERAPSISIDYGVMEGAEQVAVVPLRAGWNDVGSWDALEGVLMPDADGNLVTRSDLVAVDSYNNIVYCENKLVALVGVDDLVVVDTGDRILIGHRKQMQKVKEVVEQLRRRGRTDML